MHTYRLIMSPRAFSDLEEIHKYISADSVDNAAKVIDRILDALDALMRAPHHNIAEGIKGPRSTRTLSWLVNRDQDKARREQQRGYRVVYDARTGIGAELD